MKTVSPVDDAQDLATKAYVQMSGGGGGAGITVSATAPASPSAGDLWFDSNAGKIFIYYDSFWVDPAIGGSQGDPGRFQTSSTAPTSPVAGDAWFNSDTGEIFIYYDGVWVTPSVIAAIPAGTASTITGTNSEGSSSNFARADHDHSYGSKSIPNSALALGPTYETALPASPVNGQEIYYAFDETNQAGRIWHLRYNSSRSRTGGTGAWEFIGGSPAENLVDVWANTTSDSSSNETLTRVDNSQSSTGPSITLPRDGTYGIIFGTTSYNDTSNGGARTGLKIGGTVQSTTLDSYTANVAFALDSGVRRFTTTITTNRTVVLTYYRRSASGIAYFDNRQLQIYPVFIW